MFVNDLFYKIIIFLFIKNSLRKVKIILFFRLNELGNLLFYWFYFIVILMIGKRGILFLI